MPPDDFEPLAAQVDFPCPACGMPCHAGTVPHPFVTHKLPFCDAYDKIKTLEEGVRFVQQGVSLKSN